MLICFYYSHSNEIHSHKSDRYSFSSEKNKRIFLVDDDDDDDDDGDRQNEIMNKMLLFVFAPIVMAFGWWAMRLL